MTTTIGPDLASDQDSYPMAGYPTTGTGGMGEAPAHGLLALGAGPDLPHVGVGVARPDQPDQPRRQL